MYAGSPSDPQNFEQLESNGIKVFLSAKARTAPDGVKVALTGFGPWKQLEISGLRA